MQKEILKSRQGFESEGHNVFTEVINKIALSTNYDKRIESIGSTETYALGECKDIIHVKEKIKRYNIIQKFLTLIPFQKKKNIKKN